MENLTFDRVTLAVGVILILLGAYNTFFAARKNFREEVRRRNAPTTTLEEKVNRHDAMLASDKLRLEQLETNMKDTRDGIKHLVRGVNALIEHELHNGNAQQMQEASSDLSRWVTNKI